jgi:hypothetical protein
MVYSEEFSPKRGQEYRDRIRCEALEKHGYTVRTLDNKHTDHNIASGKHCQANFADARRMVRSIESKWGKGQVFDEIILDYFFSPVSSNAPKLLSTLSNMHIYSTIGWMG